MAGSASATTVTSSGPRKAPMPVTASTLHRRARSAASGSGGVTVTRPS